MKRFRYNLRIAAGVALGLILVLSPIVWLYTTKARETEAAWFNDNWLYRKAITITNNSGSTLILRADDIRSDLPFFRRGSSPQTQNQSKSNDRQQTQNIGIMSKFNPKLFQCHLSSSKILSDINKNKIPFTRCIVKIAREEMPTIAGETKAAPKNKTAILEKNEEKDFFCSNDKSASTISNHKV